MVYRLYTLELSLKSLVFYYDKKILKTLNICFPKRHIKLKNDKLWIDNSCLIEEYIDSLPLKQDVRSCLDSLHSHGIGFISELLSTQDCDEIIADFVDFCSRNSDSEKFRDQYGYHERLSNFHLISDSVKSFYLNQKINLILSILFQDQPKIVGSLFFEKSSEQAIHRDSPSFFTNPLNHFYGVWVALEDISIEQGPLVYFPRSHQIIPDEYLRKKFKTALSYNKFIQQQCIAHGLKATMAEMKKGDLVIWHPQLAHGGSKILNPNISRKSMVMHWMAKSATIHTPRDFFSPSSFVEYEATKYIDLFGITAVDHGKPRFFHNREEGNFDEFK